MFHKPWGPLASYASFLKAAAKLEVLVAFRALLEPADSPLLGEACDNGGTEAVLGVILPLAGLIMLWALHGDHYRHGLFAAVFLVSAIATSLGIYYFDPDNFVPIANEVIVKSGPAKGATAVTTFSDYDEVEGIIMAFTQIDKFNGNPVLEMFVKEVQLNVEVDEAIFKMPED